MKELLSALRDPDWTVSQAAAQALTRLGQAAVPPLIAALDDPSGEVARRAAYALGQIGDRRAVAPLIAALQARDPLLRWTAVGALGDLADAQAVEPILDVLRDPDPAWNVSLAASRSLTKIGEPALFPLIRLVSTFQQVDPVARECAAAALGALADERAVPPLLTLLADESRAVRWTAAAALGDLGAVQAVEPLLALLSDPDADVRAGAATALGQIGDVRALPALERLQQMDSAGTWDGETVADIAACAIAVIRERQSGSRT